MINSSEGGINVLRISKGIKLEWLLKPFGK